MSDITKEKIKDLLKEKKVLYIATKNRDYLRIEQEILLVKEYADSVDIIVSSKKSYILRLLYVYFRTLFYFKSFDIVFIGFAPQLVLPLFKWKFIGKIVCVDFFISLYDTIVFDRKKVKENSSLANLIRYIDMLTLKWADFIIADTFEHANYFTEILSAKAEKVNVLYLNADTKYYYPKIVSKPVNLQNKFLVLYFGSILPLQGMEIILDVLEKIENSDIYFIIIGPLKDKNKYEKLDNVMFIDWLSQKELSDYIAFSDLCLAGHFNDTIEKAKRVIPGKAYIYEAMGKMMILGENKANRERYPYQYDNVEFVKMGDAKELAQTISRVFENESK